MSENRVNNPVSTYISVKPELIVAATPPVYRDQKLELYRNSDIAPDGCLYIDTPYPSGILRQPTLQQADPHAFMLLLRNTDASGHVMNPATRDNTAVYCSYVRDYADARARMADFEEHTEKIRRAHENQALQASFHSTGKMSSLSLMDIDERIAAHNRQFAANPDDERSKPRPKPPLPPRRW